MRIIYNLEYYVLNKLGRRRRGTDGHVGVFETLTEVEIAKQQLQLKYPQQSFEFNIYLIEQLFHKSA